MFPLSAVSVKGFLSLPWLVSLSALRLKLAQAFQYALPFRWLCLLFLSGFLFFPDLLILKELGFKSRNEALDFLKKLWRQEKAECPICGSELEMLHKKAKKIIVIGSVRIVIRLTKQFTYWMKLMSRCQINKFQFVREKHLNTF